METFILVALLIAVAALMVIGFKNEDTVKGNRQRGKLLIAAGFGVLAVAGFVVYGFGGQGLFSIGICGLLGAGYLVRALRDQRTSRS